VTTRALNEHALAAMTRLGATPVFQTEAGFPACICTSVNEVILHGIPNDQPLRSGDVLSVDVGMLLDGYCGDTTLTVAIGSITPERQRLIDTTRGAMLAGIAAATAGRRIGDIGHAIQRHAEARGFGVMRDFTGHGLGRRMHEAPMVPFVGRRGTGPVMPEGLVITIEPILVERSPDWTMDADGWTVRTQDGGWSAQFEHTVLVTKRGAVVLSAA
jgi:methionyl aminopeptidase